MCRAVAHSLTLIAGLAVTLAAIHAASVPGFFLGTALAGAGFGDAFQGAVRSVIPLAAPHERAGVLSVFYVVAYLAMGLPAVAAGARIVFGGGVVPTANEYGVAVMLLAALAFLGTGLTQARSDSGEHGDVVPSRP